MNEIEDFLERNRIDEVECLVPDMAGIARGKPHVLRRCVRDLQCPTPLTAPGIASRLC